MCENFIYVHSLKTLTTRCKETQKRCLFLNATTGLFFPSCHIHQPKSSTQLTVKRLQRILRWQRRSFQIQTFVINSFVLVIVVVLFFLVTISTSFNYNTNILSPLWFNALILLLLLSFFLSLFLAVELSSERAAAISAAGQILILITFQNCKEYNSLDTVDMFRLYIFEPPQAAM